MGMFNYQVTLVINLDCPFNTADYIHRSGRIGRATELFPGEGECITFITQNKEAVFAHRVKVGLVECFISPFSRGVT